MMPHSSAPTSDACTDTPKLTLADRCWGKWVDGRQYTLEIIQQPIRARMCGFGDKDRRPVAPAVVAELVVREQDNSIVSHEAIDCTFFVAAVDLWSDDGMKNINMVLNQATSNKPVRGTPRKRQHSDAGPASSVPPPIPDPRTPLPLPRDLPWNYSEPTIAPEPEMPPTTRLLSPPMPVSTDGYSYAHAQPPRRTPPPMPAPLHDPMTFNPQNPYGPPQPPQPPQLPLEPVQNWYPPPPGPPPQQAATAQHRQPPYAAPQPAVPAAPPAAQTSYAQQHPHFAQHGHLAQPVHLVPAESYARADGSTAAAETNDVPQATAWNVIPVEAPAPPVRADGYYVGVWDSYAPPEPASVPAPAALQPAVDGSPPAGTYERDYRARMWQQAPPTVAPPAPDPVVYAQADRYVPQGYAATLPAAGNSHMAQQVVPISPAPEPVTHYMPQQHGVQSQMAAAHGVGAHMQHSFPPAVPQPQIVDPPPPPASQDYAHVQPRSYYVRTLVGPLVSNAYRLFDENRRIGIFFLFQDLSVRTEGTFRLRVRLMNIGVPPAPGLGSSRTHEDCSPILAQTFTEPFLVYSAKRFPGVPENTPLSTTFAKQGQKLPLRSKNGEAKGRKRRRRADSESPAPEDDED